MALRATLLLVLFPYPLGIQEWSVFCLLKNDFTFLSACPLSMSLLLICKSVTLPLFLFQFLISPDQYRMRVSMLETAGNSRDETHTPTMLYSLGRKLRHCVPREEWYFNEIPLQWHAE